MTTTTETTAAGDTRRRVTGRHILTAVIAAAVAAALAVVLLITTGQSDQISSLRSANASQSAQIAGLNKQLGQLKTAQANSDQTARTRDQANTATLGVCVNTQYGSGGGTSWVQSVDITSPTLTHGVASCPSGNFVPVSPQSVPSP
jgi:hypothetical protein